MLAHLSLNVPDHLSDEISQMLVSDDAVTNVSVLKGASVKPQGDLMEADVAREAASDIIDALQKTGLGREGGIVILQPSGTPFDGANEAEKNAGGDPDDAVVWRLVRQSADDNVHITFTFMAFLIIAVALAAIACITDSTVLVVGAMVVGPEFTIVAATCVGLAFREWNVAGRAAWMLLWTFAVAITFVTIIAWAGHELGFFEVADVAGSRPQTSFIWKPDVWSFLVALWAGAAGVLAVATDKTNAMVGVFISVTTVPAAGNMAVGFAVQDWAEVSGSLEQLGLNFVGMVVAGVVTLVAERIGWRRISDARRTNISRRVYRRNHSAPIR